MLDVRCGAVAPDAAGSGSSYRVHTPIHMS